MGLDFITYEASSNMHTVFNLEVTNLNTGQIIVTTDTQSYDILMFRNNFEFARIFLILIWTCMIIFMFVGFVKKHLKNFYKYQKWYALEIKGLSKGEL